MSEVPFEALPIMLETRLSLDEVLQLTAVSTTHNQNNPSLNALFTINGVPNPETDVYLSVYKSFRMLRAGVLLPSGNSDIAWQEGDSVTSVEDLNQAHKREGRYFAMSCFMGNLPEMMHDNIHRLAPEKLRSTAGALLGFVNCMAYYLEHPVHPLQPAGTRFTVHPAVDVYGLE